MKTPKPWHIVLTVIISIAIVVFFIAKNVNTNTFWQADAVDVINIILVIIIAVYFSGILTTKRRKYDAIERIILEVRKNVIDPNFFSTEPQSVTLQQSCANKVKYLKDSNTSIIQKDIEYIEQQLESIGTLHENHKNELDTVKADFVKHQLNILNKCDKIQMALYND